jgi:hypothetical protein
MNSTLRKLTLCLIVSFGLSVVGCAGFQEPKKQIQNVDYVGDQSVTYLSDSATVLTSGSSGKSKGKSKSKSGSKSGSKAGAYLFDLSIEVCDITDNRERTNCNTSPALETATLSRTYTGPKGIRVNQITNLFWYDPKTLYISYMQEPSMGADSTTEALGDATGIKTGSKDSFKPHVRRCRLDEQNNLDCKEVRNLNKALFIKKVK